MNAIEKGITHAEVDRINWPLSESQSETKYSFLEKRNSKCLILVMSKGFLKCFENNFHLVECKCLHCLSSTLKNVKKKIPADVLKRMVSKKFSLFLTLVNNLYQYILKTPTTVFLTYKVKT